MHDFGYLNRADLIRRDSFVGMMYCFSICLFSLLLSYEISCILLLQGDVIVMHEDLFSILYYIILIVVLFV